MCRVPGRNRTKADVLVYRIEDRKVVVKDYRPRGLLIRNTLGRCLIRRECRAYRVLAGLEGIPRFLGRLTRFAFALEHVDAVPLAEARDGRVDERVFDRLDRLLDAIHRRGVALGDLHHRDVLVGRDGVVWIVDLATASIAGRGPLSRVWFPRMKGLDRIAAARMRARWTGGDPASAAAAVGGSAAAWHVRGRRAKRWWDRLRGRHGN